MSEDDWVDKIHKDREAKRHTQEERDEEAKRQESVYEARVEEFWQEIARQFEARVARYNERTPVDLKVEFESGRVVMGKPSWNVAAESSGAGLVELSLNRSSKLLVLTRRLSTGRDDSRSLSVKVGAQDTLTADGKTVEEVVRMSLEDFLRLASGLSA